jgi:hypothetical protein
MEASMELTQFAMDEHNRHKGDENLYVRFFTAPVQNKQKSAEEGRPIFEDKTMIQIMVPGSKDNVVMREVRPGYDDRRFPKQWAAYQNSEKEVVEGTPLSQWPQMSASQVEELKYFGIRTVEQLKEVPDSTAQNFRGLQSLKTKAADWLAFVNETKDVSALQAELETRDEKIAALESTVAEMAAELKAMRETDE